MLVQGKRMRSTLNLHGTARWCTVANIEIRYNQYIFVKIGCSVAKLDSGFSLRFPFSIPITKYEHVQMLSLLNRIFVYS